MRSVVMWISGVMLLGSCGGREVVTPAVPDAKVSCAGCVPGSVYAVGAKLQVLSSWAGTCKDGKLHIGVEGGVPPETCNEQQYTLELRCAKPGCEVDAATNSFTLTQAGQHSVEAVFKRPSASDRTVKLDVTAAVPAKARMTCKATPDGKALVDLSILSAGGQSLWSPLPEVSVAGAACEAGSYSEDSTDFSCARAADATQVEVVVKSPAFSTTQTVSCAP